MAGERLPGALLSSFSMGALNEGLSARAALAVVRDTGWAVSNERWFRAFSDARIARDLAPGLTGLDTFATIPVDMHAPWHAGEPGNYAYRYNVSTYHPETGITGSHQGMVVSDVPLSPADVQQGAWDEWQDPENADIYDRVATRVDVIGAYQMVGTDAPESGVVL